VPGLLPVRRAVDPSRGAFAQASGCLHCRMLSSAALRRSWQSWWDPSCAAEGPLWLHWVWTALFAAATALPLTVLGFVANARTLEVWLSPVNWVRFYSNNLVIALLIGLSVHALLNLGTAVLGRARVQRMRPWQRGLHFGVLSTLGVLIGWPLGYILIGGSLDRFINARGLIGSAVLFSVLIALGLQMYWSARQRQADAERRAAEAQLRLLQGQIEPHFLFNTLATVLSLIERDPPKARRTLESFVDYLRVSLGEMRRDASTLRAEVELSQAYLQLMRERMDDRLRVSIDVDPSLQGLALPPLLLQPLVENAVHHGLEPKIDGGTLQISAKRNGAHLLLAVRDDGVGLHHTPRRKGNGVALHNLRERLAARYGNDASLQLTALQPGTLAELRLPLQSAP
jgi:two-component sensor histidine kinase